MEKTGNSLEESLDLTVTSEQTRTKKNLKPFSIESLISPKPSETDLEKDKSEVTTKKLSISEVFREKEVNNHEFRNNSDDQRKHLVPNPIAREVLFSNKLQETEGAGIFPGRLNVHSGNGIGTLDVLHSSSGLPMNFLEKVHSGNPGFAENISYNWPFLYNTWLHNTGLLLNNNVNSAIAGTQEFRPTGLVGITSPSSPNGENSDASLSPTGIHDGSRNSGKIISCIFFVIILLTKLTTNVPVDVCECVSPVKYLRVCSSRQT